MMFSRNFLNKKSLQALFVSRVPHGVRFFASEVEIPAAGICETRNDDAQRILGSGDPSSQAPNSGNERIAVTKKHLKELANVLAEFYVFEHVHKCPEIRDILTAKNGSMGKDWDYVRYEHDGEEIHARSQEIFKVKQGDPLISIPLPDVLSSSEWIFIENMLGYMKRKEYRKLTTAKINRLRSIRVED